ncbi:hypothetical protein KL942_000414 [Ogataea angusta]|uniref:Uncharacterized protein n=1 Tax=Pichia angusta TaxID=870730 RepID=A0AAN6DLC5_PICAN|nr:uncharacterized protein KL928_001210 [Ogataea angusta]KAG7821126.1 hypothetical protein KL928_001210 [Ogataea angusta]KAG7826173.1 hypothetical protein KL909_000225 [Ogataea angusta]KAG7843318.1 hypothetical protein KL942_000414 [Ogataea angusta]KAG7852529.1 hypothetical protein KL940_000230 [Ogataea angusta]
MHLITARFGRTTPLVGVRGALWENVFPGGNNSHCWLASPAHTKPGDDARMAIVAASRTNCRSLSVGTDASAELSDECRSCSSPTYVRTRCSDDTTRPRCSLASPLLCLYSPLGKLTRKLKRAVLPAPIVTASRKSASDSLTSVMSVSTANTSPLTSPSANLKLLSPLMPAPPQTHTAAPDIADEYFLRHQQRSAGRAHQAGSTSASSATDFDSLYSLDDQSCDRVSLHIRASSELLLGAQARELSSLLAATHDSPGWSVKDGLLIPADAAPEHELEHEREPRDQDTVADLVATDVLERLNLQ